MPPETSIHYIHRTSYSFQERLVGLFVIAALVLVLILFAFSREAATLFADKFTIYGLIGNAEGIDRDTRVIISGVAAGRVVGIDIASTSEIQIEMEILERFHPLLRQGAAAALDKPPMLGQPRIVIQGGDPGREELPADALLRIRTPPSMEDMLADIGPALSDARLILARVSEWAADTRSEDISGTLQQLHAIATNAARISATVAQGQGVAGQLLVGPDENGALPPLAMRLSTTLGEAQGRLQELGPVIAQTRTATAALPELTRQLQELLARLNQIVAAVNLQTAHLPEMVQSTRVLMEQADTTLRAVQGTWPISRGVPPPTEQTLIEARPLP